MGRTVVFRQMAIAGIAVLTLAGCASGVQRVSTEPVPAYAILTPRTPATAVSVSLSPEAQKLLADNLKFNQDQLLATVKRALDANNLLAKDGGTAGPRVEILVKDIRVRSTFTAIMFGIMAGTDSLSGDVIVRDAYGQELQRFNVSAAYGLGGLAGGQDDARMSWMYEKFAEHTLNELTGTKK
jgi:hypothetical protein